MFRKFLLFLLLFSISSSYADEIAYLSWRRDPTTTMTVQWVVKSDELTEPLLYYKKKDDPSWYLAVAEKIPFPESAPYTLFRVELDNLDADSTYHFKTGTWHMAPRKFRTLPKNAEKPIRFVVGGDMYHNDIKYLIETHHEAAKTAPFFALVGGDIAYSGEKSAEKKNPKEAERWVSWLKAWSEEMVTPEGFTIPFIPALGNHDANGRYLQLKENASFFYTLFPFPEMGYGVIDIGNYLSVIVLDTDHTNTVESQAKWLYKTLEKRQSIPHTFALYHVPAYPSVRKLKSEVSTKVRTHWSSIFERFSLSAAFEHHDHAYKRTHPIVQKEIDPKGVVYMGDGAWGVKNPRRPKSIKKTWYLANAKKARHFIEITLQDEERSYRAISSKGEVIDTFSQ